MEKQVKSLTHKRCRNNERGAALVTVLMITFLLLVAVIALLLESSMNAANVTDATAEQQAYYAAESGIQSTINVLRGNTLPNPLINPTATHEDNKISFTKAIKTSTSNFDADTSAKPRLSRWINYDATDRATLGTSFTNPYNAQTGFAYQVTVEDPDRSTESLTYYTTGRIYVYGENTAASSEKTFTSGGSSLKIKYNSVSSTDVTFPSNPTSTAANFGSFTVTASGTGVTIPAKIRFEIVVKVTAQHVVDKAIRGTITGGSSGITLTFDSQLVDLAGGKIALNIPVTTRTLSLGTGGSTNLTGTMTPIEPTRLLIRSTGFGPRGAKKQLEAIVQKNFLDGLAAPATLTLIGSKDGFVFHPGTSAKVTYSGDDVASTINIPSIGTSNFDNLDAVLQELDKNSVKTDPQPPPTDVSVEMPDWLTTPYKLDQQIQAFRATAKQLRGRYYPNDLGQLQPAKGDFGNVLTGEGITFIDGDATLSDQGGGILICTGKLTLDGGVDFKGLIIVTGAGGIDRNGSGNGNLQGNTVVAPYNPADITNPLITAQFLAPKYNLNGGGTSTIQYNSNSISNGLLAVSNFIKGIAEK